MKFNKIQAVCFDMWGTLYEGVGGKEWEDLQQNLGARGVEKKTFYKLGLDSLLLQSWSLRDGIRYLAKKLTNITPLSSSVILPPSTRWKDLIVEKAYRSWWQIVEKSKPYPETIGLLKKLKRIGLRLIIISNTDSESFYFKIKQYNLGEYFEKYFISSETGSLKHTGNLFQSAQNYLKLPKDLILMVDDSFDHGVLPARNFGWQALLVARGKNSASRRKDKFKIEDLRGIFDYL